MSEPRVLSVPDGLDGLRVDVALARLFGLSRTSAAALVDAGDVLLDGTAPARSAKVRAGALLEVRLPEARPAVEEEPVEGLTVCYDDEHLVVVDKPVGVAVHASPGWSGPTVLGGLAAMGYRIATSGAAERHGVVHRLDVGTTGVMVVAKSELAYSVLKRAFRRRTVDKRYAALVQGHPDPTRGTIDAPIGRHPGAEYKFAVIAGGRVSVTHYETVEAFRAATLLEVRLETGRTHQIRVHMAAINHPCVGDLTYGADPTLALRLGLARQWLHACSLSFEHPATGEWLTVTAPPPADLRHALDALRVSS
ncbi:MAG: RluA family pseudouridine synthase [Actinomycetia bacterium]|nr:RluA family pseudouridine synthase [Actinomycetes bacterium]